jgi:hypothetical protein
MIRLGNAAHFTPHERDEFREIGLDLGKVRHQDDIEQEVSRWASTLADERFDRGTPWRRTYRRGRKRWHKYGTGVKARRVAISQDHIGIGAGSRNRTHDQRFTKPLLYQLSYAGA